MQTPIMEWNTRKKIWQYSTDGHLFELWAPWLETWPTSGIAVNGQVFALPTPERLTTDLESLSSPTQVFGTVTTATSGRSPEFRKGANPNPVEFAEEIASKIELLRSPTASQGEGGALGEEEARKRGNTVGIRNQAMDLAKLNGQKVTKLPTPTVSDSKGAARSEVEKGNPKSRLKVEVELMPTTRTSMKNGVSQEELDAGNPKFRLEAVTNWGKFAPAIERWEKILGRKAPAPTKPDGKDGAHRLSSEFTEFLMGVPEGWITDVGLTRNEELKACGNGVVPQQAALALRVLLEGVSIPAGGGQVNLPTPTVSDIFTDNLKSSQQKPGSMHSVTLPQAVRMVTTTE